MKPFESFLATELNEFLCYRENLGYSIRTLRSGLLNFDQYLKLQKSPKCLLNPIFFLEFRTNLKLNPSSVNSTIYTVRVFFEYLIRKGLYSTNPLQDIPPMSEKAFFPFVFSPKETEQLLSVVCKRIRKTSEYYLKDLSTYLAIVLLARCGLRISEPVRLLFHHYRPCEKTLYIEKTKFKKDRLIPIPESVAMEIENYLSVRNIIVHRSENPYLLLSEKQKGLSRSQIYTTFKRTVKHTGFNQQNKTVFNTTFGAPTPHSMRHSFAINTLKRIKNHGKSPQNALPVLAAYMGHREYRHTAKYLTVLDAKQRQGLFTFLNSYHGPV